MKLKNCVCLCDYNPGTEPEQVHNEIITSHYLLYIFILFIFTYQKIHYTLGTNN
jgi:hypothetical protein